MGEQNLELRRLIPAPAERIFEAWTRPEALTLWFAPTADHRVIVHDADVRVGGRFRIEMRHKGGASHIAAGEYRQVEPPRLLSFTWKWEGTAMDDTLVSVELLPQGSDTELILRHCRFATEAERDRHSEGWTGCLARLTGALAPAAEPTGPLV